MKGDEKVIEYLNKALRHELTAVSQYWVHYRLLDDWGFKKLAKHERAESIEEMEHADSLVERIIMLDGFPNMQQLDPLMIGENLMEVLESDLKAEYHARDLYIEARDVCREKRDYVSMNLFEKLLDDEEGHIDWIETQLENIKAIGIENYGALQSAAADESE